MMGGCMEAKSLYIVTLKGEGAAAVSARRRRRQ
jgi:hypothetical protein